MNRLKITQSITLFILLFLLFDCQAWSESNSNIYFYSDTNNILSSYGVTEVDSQTNGQKNVYYSEFGFPFDGNLMTIPDQQEEIFLSVEQESETLLADGKTELHLTITTNNILISPENEDKRINVVSDFGKITCQDFKALSGKLNCSYTTDQTGEATISIRYGQIEKNTISVKSIADIPYKLVFIDDLQNIYANDASSFLHIQIQDMYGHIVALENDTDILIESTDGSNGEFFLPQSNEDNWCGAGQCKLTIPAGTKNTMIKYRSNKIGRPVLSVNDLSNNLVSDTTQCIKITLRPSDLLFNVKTKFFTDFKFTTKSCVFIIKELLINNNDTTIEEDDEIGVFVSDNLNEDLLVGASQIGKKAKEFVLIHAYTDDPSTIEKDGAYNNDIVFFKFWDKSENKEYLIANNRINFIHYEGILEPQIPMVWTSFATFGLLSLNACPYIECNHPYDLDGNSITDLNDLIIALKYLTGIEVCHCNTIDLQLLIQLFNTLSKDNDPFGQ